MIPPEYKKYLLPFAKPAGFLLVIALLSCGGWDFGPDPTLSVFPATTLAPPKFKLLAFNTWDYDFPNDAEMKENDMTANVKEWQQFLKGDLTEQDVIRLVYHDNLTPYKNLNEALKDTGRAMQWLVKNKMTEAFNYLQFVRGIEPLMLANTMYDPWAQPGAANDLAGWNIYKDSIVNLISKSKSDFIKLRYAYHLVRLACYTGNYQDCINYYDHQVEQSKSNSIIKYWALCIKARALYKSGAPNYSQYCYAVVFNQCPTRMQLAQQGFRWAEVYARPPSEGFVRYPDAGTAFQYCKNDLEKVPLYALNAFRQVYTHADLLDTIYQIAPKSEMLEWLLTLGINQYEPTAMPPQNNPNQNWPNSILYGSEEEQENPYKGNRNEKDFMAFVMKCADNGDTHTPSLWNLAAADLNWMAGNYPLATMYAAKIKLTGDSIMDGQKKIMELLIKVSALSPFELNEKKEAELAHDFEMLSRLPEKLNANDVRSYLLLNLSNKYIEQGNTLKSTLCISASTWGINLKYKPREKPIDQLIAFEEKENKSTFEGLLASGAISLNDLYYTKATVLMTQHKYQEALAAFAKTSDYNYTYANPFEIYGWLCPQCLQTDTSYKAPDIARKLLELENKASTAKGKELAQVYWQLANAAYNMTNFGNSVSLTEYPHFRAYNYGVLLDTGAAYYMPSFDCSRAKSFYLKTIQTTRDKELAAKCYFMLAECVQNEYYVSKNWLIGKYDVDRTYSQPYFKKLKDHYRKTKLYKEAINECGYFSTYVQKN
jgi:hypothetical protein